MGLTIQNLSNIEPNSRNYIWSCLVAAAQNNKLGVVEDYVDGMLEASGVRFDPFPTDTFKFEDIDQKLQLMGATPMQVLTNLSGSSEQFLLKLPPVPSYKSIVIYADTLPPYILALVLSALDSKGYDYQIDTGFPEKLEDCPQPSIAICDDCTAHIIRVGRGLHSLILAAMRPCFTSSTVYDRFIEFFIPLNTMSQGKGINWSDQNSYAKCTEIAQDIPAIVDFMLEL